MSWTPVNLMNMLHPKRIQSTTIIYYYFNCYIVGCIQFIHINVRRMVSHTSIHRGAIGQNVNAVIQQCNVVFCSDNCKNSLTDFSLFCYTFYGTLAKC